LADDFNTDGVVDATKWSYNEGTGSNGWEVIMNYKTTKRAENIQVKGWDVTLLLKSLIKVLDTLQQEF
jgi:hypothetical protein